MATRHNPDPHRAPSRAPLRRRAFRLPDTSAPGFAEEARRQAQRIAASMRAGDDLAFAQSAQYWPQA